jgi:hypothetical protein
MAEFLVRITTIRDLLDNILWAQAEPMQAAHVAIKGLQSAQLALKASGYCESMES